jgi:hypothetical protein
MTFGAEDWSVVGTVRDPQVHSRLHEAARHADDTRTFYVVAPGRVRTDLGGEYAPLDIETSVRGVLRAMRARRDTGTRVCRLSE